MPVTIGQLTTDVIVSRSAAADATAAPAPAGTAAPTPEVRAEIAATARDEWRTRAEGFDD